MEAASASSSAPAWSDLPPDLVGCVVTGLRTAADCARLRAVCRSWRSAMRHHGTPARQPPPWVLLPAADACFLHASSHGRSARHHRPPASFPEKARCVGSTGSWLVLALDAGPAAAAANRSYRLHNPFTGTTVPLPELGAAMNAAPEKKKMKIRKMLVRSSGPRVVLVAVMTGDPIYPIVLTRPGKGAWLYKAHADLLTSIVDIAFLGDRLYGMTRAEELFFIDVGLHDDDDDMVGDAQRVVENPMRSDDDSSHAEEAIGEDDVDEDEAGDDHGDEEIDEEDSVVLGGVDCVHVKELENDGDMVLECIHDRGVDDDGGTVLEGMDCDDDDDDTLLEGCHYVVDDDEDPLESMGFNITTWHLVESRGKLLMVKPRLQCQKGHVDFARNVEVFEADMSAGAAVWVPVVGGLGGQSLFISRSFCKSVRACGEIEADAIYFIDTGDTFSMISQSSGATKWDLHYYVLTPGILMWERRTWILLPDIVV